MKLSAITIEKLSEIILGENQTYKSGPQLVKFFNDFLSNKESYGQSFPSRKDYTQQKLEELNESDQLKKLIKEAFSLVHFDVNKILMKKNIDYFNHFLEKDGYSIKISENNYQPSIIIVFNNGLLDSKNIEISNKYIEEQVKKCKLKITDNDLDGAITNARSLVEAVMEFVLCTLGYEKPKHNGDLLKLYKEVKTRLNLHTHKDMSDTIKQILSGLNSIVTGIAGLSNKISDRHAREHIPLKKHAKLAVNSSFILCDFLLAEMADQKKTSY